jgi:hypothetical protein
VTNNPDRAEDYLKRAEELEEAQTTAGHADAGSRLVLLGKGDASQSVRETVRVFPHFRPPCRGCMPLRQVVVSLLVRRPYRALSLLCGCRLLDP